MMDKQEYNKAVKELARMLYAYLKEHYVGREISTSELVCEKMNPEDVPIFPPTEKELWDVENALWTIVGQGHKYVMDKGRYDHQYVGLPHNIPFIFRLKKGKHDS